MKKLILLIFIPFLLQAQTEIRSTLYPKTNFIYNLGKATHRFDSVFSYIQMAHRLRAYRTWTDTISGNSGSEINFLNNYLTGGIWNGARIDTGYFAWWKVPVQATPSSVISAGTGLSWDGNTLNCTVSGGTGSAGGWTRYTAQHIYSTNNGDTVHIRSTASDTSSAGGLLIVGGGIYGTWTGVRLDSNKVPWWQFLVDTTEYTKWRDFEAHPHSRITAGDGIDWTGDVLNVTISGSGSAGGWMRYANPNTYTANPGDTVHIRAAPADTSNNIAAGYGLLMVHGGISGGSLAIGHQVVPNGSYSVATGYKSIASGFRSLAQGDSTRATGLQSTALGYHTLASNTDAVAMGESTVASGTDAVASGSGTIASGAHSFTSGNSGTAAGNGAFSAGYNNMVYNSYTAAFGYENTDVYGGSASNSFVAGSHNTINGESCFGVGQYTKSLGTVSAAFNNWTRASGYGASAFGNKTIAKSYMSLALGQFNYDVGDSLAWQDTNRVFTVGIGTNSNARKNALEVLATGNVKIQYGTIHALNIPLGTFSISDTSKGGWKLDTNRVLRNEDSTTIKWGLLKNTDSTTVKWGLLKNTDSTTLKWGLLKNADSTTLRNQFLKNDDSTTLRNQFLKYSEAGTAWKLDSNRVTTTEDHFLAYSCGADSGNTTTSDKFFMGSWPVNIVVDSVKFSFFSGTLPNMVPTITYADSINTTGTSFGSFALVSKSSIKVVVPSATTVPANQDVYIEWSTITAKPKRWAAMVIGHKATR